MILSDDQRDKPITKGVPQDKVSTASVAAERGSGGVVVAVLLVTVALCATGWLALKAASENRPEPSAGTEATVGIAVRVAVAELKPVTHEINVSGFLSPFQQLTLAAQVPGYIEKQHVEVSDQVVEDQALYELDRALRVVALDKANAAADRARSELALAEENVRRIERLEEQRSANPTEVLQVNTQHAVAIAMVKQADAAVEEAKILLERAIIRSPVTGEVAALHRREGEYTHIGQPLLDVIETDRLKLIVQLNDREVEAFEGGDLVRFVATALPAEPFEGRIARVYPRAAVDSRKFEVEIEVPNEHRRLRPGFFVNAVLSDDNESQIEQSEVITIPRMAVFEVFRQHYCYIIRREENDAGDTVDIAVRTGVVISPLLAQPQIVEVLHGVDVGDRVVTTGVQHLSDRDPVRVIE